MPKRIVTVDDEPHIRRIVELKLKGAGYEVKSATNAAAGLDLVKEWLPDLLISDYKMPGGMNGIDLIRAVRETAEVAGTPVILLTGSVAVMRQLKDALSDVSGILLMSKPFSPRNLIKEVARILDDGGATNGPDSDV